MTKTKKQRNHVLIRRVKRTSAAILLVMAVAVAAIPVENLGTVQAEDTDTTFDMGTTYSSDEDSVTTGVYTSSVLQGESDSNYEKNFTSSGDTSIKVVQQVSGSSTLNIEDVYKVTLSSETSSPMEAVVSGIGTMTDITVNSTEYYGLVMFRVSNENINVSIDSLQVTFAAGTETTSDSSAGTVSVSIENEKGYYKVNGSGDTYQAFTINSGTLNKVSSTTYTGDSEVTLNSEIQDDSYIDDSNGYNGLYGSNSGTVTHKTLIDGAEKAALATKQEEIENYNSDLTKLAEIATKLNSGTEASPATLTTEEYELWTKYASDYSNLENAAKTLSISKNNFADEDGNGLADVYDYIIRNYYGVSPSNNLKDYALVAATYKATGATTSETVYVAKLTGNNAQKGQYLYEADGSKYLATGQAKIVGVKSEAFKGDTTLTSISLPSSIKYIGESAFESCSVLSKVTLDATSCVLIGDSAFKNSGLTSFTISSGAALKSIGVCAFENTKLTGITIPSSVTELCNCSFMGISTLKSVEFSSRTSNITIGKYAFYNCNALTSVEFGTNSQTYYIQKGAFAVDHDHVDAAMDFSFPSSNYKIDYSSDDGDNNTKGSTDYDYILAGRRNLGTVTFTLTSGTVPTNTLRGCYNLKCAVFIDNAANAGYTTYDNAVTTPQLFSDVTNDEFYVKGPATKSNSTTVAQPRSDSWTGILGYTLSNGSYAPVPYMYEINGKTYIDLGYNFSGDLYVATVEVLDESAKTAELSSYQVNTAHGNPSGYRISIEIPDEVGGYKIVSIGDNCFTDTIKGIVYEIIIPDGGYITTIGDSAFEGCDYLERVYIGSSVAEIGDEAFANCPMLENVEFGFDVSDWWNLDDDDDAWTELTIGDNAFQTKSEHLTFHGAINADYAPYALAMSSSSDDMTTTGAHICYKTDAPLNLTVLRNESTGEATLVDYPHYDEIDDINKDYIEEEYAEEGTTEACTYSITEGFEDVLEGSTELSAYPDAELDMVEAALYLNLPSGIKSVDSKLLFEGSGSSKANDSDDKFYVNYTYEYNSENAGKTTKSEFKNNPVYEQKYWTTDERSESRLISYTYAVDGSDSTNGHYDSSYASAYGDTDVSIGGLFSGYFDEDGVKKSLESGSGSFKVFLDDSTSYGGHTYVSETYDSGNDYLTSVDMPTVTALPDYAFDSCENLLTAAFTDAMESMGALPFRDCKEMYSIDLGTTTTDSTGDTISTNGYFAFKNLILYAVDDDGSYEITEVLEGRGSSSGSEYLGSGITKSDIIDGGSNVTSIAKGAFSNNGNLTTVDLSNTEVVEIPEDCFENDTKLYQITLPDTTRTVDAYAFDTGSDVTVYIPNNLCTLSTEAKTDGETLTICGEKLLDDGSVSPLYYSYEKMQTVYGEDNVVWSETESECVVTFLNKDLTVLQTITVDKGGSLSYIPTAQKVSGYDFECWLYIVSSTEVLSGTVYTDDIFTDITEDRTYYPSYTANPSSVESDGNSYVFQFENCAAYVDGKAITSGTTLTGGTTVTLLADADTFGYWSVSSGDSTDYTGNLEYGISQYLNTFTMPNASVKVTANLATSSGSSGSSGSSSSDDDDDDDDDEDTYTLTVNYGSGSGEYEAGEKVTIAAYAPESSTKVFSKWTTTNSDVGFASATAATTTLVMPSEDVTVTANYKTRTSDDDDDDDDDDSSSSSGRTSVASTTTATNGTNGSGTSTTTTSTSTTTSTESGSADDGNKIYITKNGISNKDVASITVEGSTDNFIVRISESDEATEAAKLALTNEYGSLDNLVYFPMDISLYDATGQNKITDSYGLNITVTMPIPDVLIQYGGNARVAACDDGVLTQITPKFTTIDGIACISFTPPHFSPYVIYVDTSNLTAGTLDSTPKTGDPIHPKWFLAIGLGCASVVLFATSDGRKRRKFRTV